MREALEMTAHKTARILTGEPSEPDHWLDKAGYYTLVANCLSGPPVPVPVPAVAPDLESEMATLISSSGSGVFAEAQVIE